ncbi:hypothetical protein VKT23_013734 [Stygiomarasmius scandens]|uniref:Sorbose reductase sou1 n=1 Tax=Marasmiellus scandens TaxID=2682957 RepID=A0ABR1J2F3_9AGAR
MLSIVNSLSQTRISSVARLFRGHDFSSSCTCLISQKATFYTRSVHSRSQQSESRLAPIGVSAALDARTNSNASGPKIFKEFSLSDRVCIVSGGNRGLGLDMALALCEAGARAVYCLDLPERPGEEWEATRAFVERMKTGVNADKTTRLEYVSVDVTDQEVVWKRAEEVGDKEGRVDVCVAAAGVSSPSIDCLEFPGDKFRKVLDVNTSGVFFTAQAAGRQMRRFGIPGSIVLISSMTGTIMARGHETIPYNTSKGAVNQMTRSMACELGKEGIRVNSISPGYIFTRMVETSGVLQQYPDLIERWSSQNPLGRIGRPDELRGVVTWLASDASTFCTGSDILVTGGHHAW